MATAAWQQLHGNPAVYMHDALATAAWQPRCFIDTMLWQQLHNNPAVYMYDTLGTAAWQPSCLYA